MFLLIGNYNSYYNRIVKKQDTLIAYKDQMGSSYVQYDEIDFNPGNGVNTSQVFNYTPGADKIAPDYLVCFEDNATTNSAPVSRWFVIGWERIRGNQYRAILHRDCIVDNYNAILTAPMYIEKATPKDINSVFIFNDEQLEVSQIKTKQELLKDNTNTPWLVGYCQRLPFASGDEREITASRIIPSSVSVSSLEEWPLYGYIRKIIRGHSEESISTTTSYNHNIVNNVPISLAYTQFAQKAAGTGNSFYMLIRNNGGIFYFQDATLASTHSYDYAAGYARSYIENWPSGYSTFSAQAARYYGNMLVNIFNNENLNSYLTYPTFPSVPANGTVIYDQSEAKYYRINVIDLPPVSEGYNYYESITQNSSYINKFKQCVSSMFGDPENTTWSEDPNIVRFPVTKRYLVLEQITASTLSTTFPSDYLHTSNATYDMFCCPYSPDNSISNYYYNEQGTLTIYDNSAMMYIMTSAAKKLDSKLYDLQLVPYCPLENELFTNNYLDVRNIPTGYSSSQYYMMVKDGDDNELGPIFFCNSAMKNIDIDYNINVPGSVEYRKLYSCTKKWRLNAPNWSSIYDFNPYKNNGVSGFKAYCDFKPQTTTILVRPNFKYLYGDNYRDSRGLYITNDFSVSYMKGAYESFLVQNKYYQQIFDRQIENQEFHNNQENIKTLLGIGSGIVSGAAQGAKGGVGGAIAGAVASAAGGLIDYKMQIDAQKENLDYTKDNFNYSLKTMQAQPDTLVGVGSITYCNTIWPTIELYECSQEETEAFQNKLKYNGYSIHAVGTISDYISNTPSYIKGQLIRLEIPDSNEIINAISSELYKGVFI